MNKELTLYYDKVTSGMQCIRCKDIFQSDDIVMMNRHVTHSGCWHQLPLFHIPWMTLDEAGQWECGCGFISKCTKEDAFEHQMQHAKYKLDILSKTKAGFKT
jgi:hypothetical protein